MPRWRSGNLTVVFDAADLSAESAFWAGVLGGEVFPEDHWHMIAVNGEPRVGVQLAPGHTAPDWPNGTPQQIHLDLWVGDIAVAHEMVMTLGARVLQTTTMESAWEGFQVYADPAGHPFCLCWHEPSGV